MAGAGLVAAHRRSTVAAAAGVTLILLTVVAALASQAEWAVLVSSYTLSNLVIGAGFLVSGAAIYGSAHGTCSASCSPSARSAI